MSGDLDPVDHRYIVAGKNNGGMGIYDSTREEKKKFIKIGAKKAGTRGTHLRGINCIQWYPMDAGLFSTSSSDSLIKIWDPNSLTKVDEFNLGCRIHYHHMSLVASRHSLLAAAGETGDVILCDLRTGSSTHRLHGHDGRVQVVQWTKHNENHVSSGGRDNCIRIWDVRSGKACLQVLNEVNDPSAYDEPKRSRSHSQAVQSHSSLVTSLCYSYDGLSLISLSYDGVIKIWDTASYKLRKIKFKNTKNYFKKAFSIPITHNLFPDVIYVPNKHNIAVFDISTGERIHVLKAHCSSIYGAIYNPVSGDLYSFGEDKNFLVWTPSRLSKPKEWKELLEIGNGHDRSMADNWSSDED